MLLITKAKADSKKLLQPSASQWSAIRGVAMTLKGTPIGTQPTAYTRTSWKDKKIGAVSAVEVKACHNGDSMFVRLEWIDPRENRSESRSEFPDGAAVIFPIGGDAPLNTMGNEREGVNAWQWRADSSEGHSVVAHGIGTTEPNNDRVSTAAVYEGGRWKVVIARSLAEPASGDRTATLNEGGSSRLGVAIWEGSNGERAGFKAYTEDWTDIRLAAGD